MLFVSLTFLFLFLPMVLGLYYILKGHRNLQNIVLFLASLFFYAWGEPKFVVVLLISIICNWLLAALIDRSTSEPIRKTYLSVAVLINIGLLFVYKYLNFFVAQINHLGSLDIQIREIALPIGISFFTFQALSYVIDVFRGEKCQSNPFYVGLYISFFPQLIAGPIIRYNTIEDQILNRKESFDDFKYGTLRFVQGFSKKVLLANTMAVIADKAFSLTGGDLTVSFAWLGAIAYTLQIFFDFSGYSDMAIGLGKMFGFHFDENFNYPYISSSVTEFWRRWHISLSTWFRDYVYIPLGGNRTGSSARNYLNLFVVWLLTGIWHGANWTFIAWGLLYFVFLIIEKATQFGRFINDHKVIGHIYTLFVVIMLWVIFRADGIHQAATYIGTMLGIAGADIYSGMTWVYIKENLVYFIFAVALSTDLFARIRNKREVRISVFADIAGEVCLAAVFAVSIVYIINGTYNPFIYFHF
ncbi:MAG: MBOAT family protein [Mogibacterium sp.]|nr:MBOAT family protein [Mogibacterium sp.]